MKTQHVKSNETIGRNLEILSRAEVSDTIIARNGKVYAKSHKMTWYKTRASALHAIAAIRGGHGSVSGDRREVLEIVTSEMCLNLVSKSPIRLGHESSPQLLIRMVDHLYVLHHLIMTGETIPVPNSTPRGEGFHIPGNKGEEEFYNGLKKMMEGTWLPNLSARLHL